MCGNATPRQLTCHDRAALLPAFAACGPDHAATTLRKVLSEPDLTCRILRRQQRGYTTRVAMTHMIPRPPCSVNQAGACLGAARRRTARDATSAMRQKSPQIVPKSNRIRLIWVANCIQATAVTFQVTAWMQCCITGNNSAHGLLPIAKYGWSSCTARVATMHAWHRHVGQRRGRIMPVGTLL